MEEENFKSKKLRDCAKFAKNVLTSYFNYIYGTTLCFYAIYIFHFILPHDFLTKGN